MGAQSVAAAIWLGRHGHGKQAIRGLITEKFEYDLSVSCAEFAMRGYDVTCPGTVPAALVAFLLSDS